REPADKRRRRCGEEDRGRVGEKVDQRRRVDRRGDEVAGNPSPGSVDVGPSPVMGWGKAPGLIGDPGPAPRLDPAPITVAVGDPSYREPFGVPDLAVIGGGAPAAIV